MPGFNPDKINIHELTIEEPEKQAELFFDVERDVTPEDWEGMEKKLRKLKNGLSDEDEDYRWIYFSKHAFAMKMLNAGVDLKLNPNLLQDFLEWNAVHSNVEATAHMKLLFPRQEMDFDWDRRKRLKNSLKFGREEYFHDFPAGAAGAKLLGLGVLLSPFLDKAAWIQMNIEAQKAKDNGNWEEFIDVFSNMKIIDQKAVPPLVEEDWQAIKKTLPSLRGDWARFSAMAMGMKILAAERVEVTDKGLEVTMPEKKKNLGTYAPPLPETKQF